MRWPAAALLLLGAAVTAGCSPGVDAATATLTVSAASSLTDAFGDLATRFEEQHPGVDVVLNLAGSSALAEQVNAGAPVDVLATASATTMAAVVDAGNAARPTAFATNRLTIAVPPGNPREIGALADLAAPGIRTAICAPEVPCGAATAELLARARLTIDVATLDPDVRSVLGRVTADEVDAGIVYVTDVRAADGAAGEVAVPEDVNVSTDYLVAEVADAEEPALARAFVDLVTGPTGQRVLADLGFGAP